MSPRLIRLIGLTSVCLGCGWMAPESVVAAPTIAGVSLRGLQLGGTTTVVVEGTELQPDARVLLPFAIARQVVRPGATESRVELEITLDANAPVGLHALRMVSAKGVSNPIMIGVDALPQRAYEPQIGTIPVALHGVLSGSEILRTKFAGRSGERIAIDVECQRLGSKVNPVLRLIDPRGTQFAWSPPLSNLAGDARCEAVLPVDGQYTIELHDRLYRAESPGFFRLKVGALRFADLVFPLGVQRGHFSEVRVIASGSFGEPRAAVSATAGLGMQPVDASNPFILTGTQPRVIVSDCPEILEQPSEASSPPGNLQRIPHAPVGINGRLLTAGEEDQYVLAVQPQSRLRFDVLARRAGSPLDAVLFLRGENGAELARGDDRPGSSDPGLDFVVPDGVTALVVAVGDLQKQGGADFVYRIGVQDLSRPDFSLALDAAQVNIPAGGTQIIRVQADRVAYQGPIHLALSGLPEGVAVAGNEIPPGAAIGLVSLTAPPTTAVQGLVSLFGTGVQDQIQVTRSARLPEDSLSRHQPWLREQIAVASAPPSPIGLTWSPLTSDQKFVRGGKFPLRVNITRAAGAAGNVRLQVMTTQMMPKRTVKQDNKDVMVDDVDRAVRLEGAPVIPADATEATVHLLVPTDLPGQPWGVLIIAELLGADQNAVVVAIPSPPQTFVPVAPFALELVGPAAIQVKAGGGDTGQLTGKLIRTPGFDQPVTVTLASLPDGYPAPQVSLAADQTEFTLPVRFPYGAPPMELKDSRLVATITPNAERADLALRSNELPVTLSVVPGERPPAEPPLAIFEDEEKFLSYLSDGGGQLSLETTDKHAGTASIKVTPDQRFKDVVPGLGVKIRRDPGAGEYRYLRFAWKKRGGAAICVQLNHDGQWGPSPTNQTAKFRYHAGPGGECYGASLAVADQLPADFVVVTRDLFADFGEFTLTGLALSPVDGEYGLFDHFYLGRAPADFDLIQPAK